MWLPDTPQDHDNRMYEAGRADAADRIKELEAMVRELADELAAEFEARHPASAREQQPATQRAYDRDMAIVRQARKLIEQ